MESAAGGKSKPSRLGFASLCRHAQARDGMRRAFSSFFIKQKPFLHRPSSAFHLDFPAPFCAVLLNSGHLKTSLDK